MRTSAPLRRFEGQLRGWSGGIALTALCLASAARAEPAQSVSLEEAALMAELDAEIGDSVGSTSDPGIELYGFADFTFQKLFVNQSSPVRAYLHTDSSFSVGNLNLYLASDLGSDWRALSEVRLTFLPNGSRKVQADGVERVDTEVMDYTNFGGQPRTGSIIIQRAWLEHRFDNLLNVRVGNWLTPYGIWNVDHGSPTIIPVVRPYVIALELMPESQTGIQLHGQRPVSENLTLGYALAVSNGRGPIDDYADLDANKAITARARGTYRGLGTLEMGATAYYGRYTDKVQRLTVNGTEVSLQDRVLSQYDELAWGVDARWTLDGFHTQAELLVSDARYTPGNREQRTAVELQPDRRSWGGYVIVGYRFDWLGLMPYVTAEYFELVNEFEITRPPRSDVITDYSLGLNARPTATVTLKAEINVGLFPGAPAGSAFESSIWAFQSQAAWAF